MQEYYCAQVKTSSILGQGSFGTVYKGSINNKTVAVKINSWDNNNAIKELNRMKKATHPNIIELLGTVPLCQHGQRCQCDGSRRNTTWIIMEYMPRGNLLEYIRQQNGGICASGMMKMAYQVACGMWYLHRDANIIHTDLAARNVLVEDDDYNVKIGDFGTLQDYDYSDHYYEDAYGARCPIRWMPPENLPMTSGSGRYSRKGDVWSFGVLLFELWSRGKTPFEGIDDDEEVMDCVSRGETVLDYENINARSCVINLMNECFEYEKDDRPNFRSIRDTIYNEL